MKVFISDKTIAKLQEMLENLKPDTISVRKFKSGDKAENVISKVKLPERLRTLHKTGKTYSIYISKELLRKVKKQISGDSEKTGGFLPFLPLIFGGLGALGALAGGSAAVAKTVIDKNRADAELEETKRHNLETEKAITGSGITESIRQFTKSLDTTSDERKAIKNILKGLGSVLKIEKQGDGLYLRSKP